MSDILQMTACEMLRAYAAGTLSPVEVVKAALQRIDRVNGHLNIFYLVQDDEAVEAARASEARWREGRPRGLVDGIPTSVKDAIFMKGTPTYRGSAAHDADNVESRIDAPCVARLKEQGAIILGKTTMPDFGMLASGYSSKHGVTRNPWDRRHNPGGSSSGAAASIAAGINPLAVGTDIVGSIRLPASFCGLAGLKPSQYRVPYYFPNSPALVAGPMARSVEDAALLMTVISQPDNRDFTALPYDGTPYLQKLDDSIRGLRVGLLNGLGWGPPPDPELVGLVESAANTFSELGCVIVPKAAPFSPGEERSAENFYRARTWTELSRFPEVLRERAPVIGKWAEPASEMSAATLYRCHNEMQMMRERALHLFGDIDYLLLASVPVPPYLAELPGLDQQEIFAPWSSTFVFNLTEQPAASVNCGFTSRGLPVGLQIVGRRFDDAGVLKMARSYEKTNPMTRPWPLA